MAHSKNDELKEEIDPLSDLEMRTFGIKITAPSIDELLDGSALKNLCKVDSKSKLRGINSFL
jgi:hypothetical protein